MPKISYPLEEILADLNARIMTMQTNQLERWARSGVPATTFLNMDHEEQITKELRNMIRATLCIEMLIRE